MLLTGGGLLAPLGALAIAEKLRSISFRLLIPAQHPERPEFKFEVIFADGLSEGAKALLEPLVVGTWASYLVRHSAFERRVDRTLWLLSHDQLVAELLTILGAAQILTYDPREVSLGDVVEAIASEAGGDIILLRNSMDAAEACAVRSVTRLDESGPIADKPVLEVSQAVTRWRFPLSGKLSLEQDITYGSGPRQEKPPPVLRSGQVCELSDGPRWRLHPLLPSRYHDAAEFAVALPSILTEPPVARAEKAKQFWDRRASATAAWRIFAGVLERASDGHRAEALEALLTLDDDSLALFDSGRMAATNDIFMRQALCLDPKLSYRPMP